MLRFKDLANHIIKPLRVSKGPYTLKKYCKIPLTIKGIVPNKNSNDISLLSLIESKNGWNPKKQMNKGIQFASPYHDKDGDHDSYGKLILNELCTQLKNIMIEEIIKK